MNQKTWPNRSNGSPFASIPFSNGKKLDVPLLSGRQRATDSAREPPSRPESSSRRSRPENSSRRSRSRRSTSRSHSRGSDFSTLPNDLMEKIAASFTHPELQAASLVCRSWRDALAPLREAMTLLLRGKCLKYGRGGVRRNLEAALNSFMKGAALGSPLAMVDAGLMYWEMGLTERAMALYRRAAELGNVAGQCNLGILYWKAQPQNRKEAMKWLYKASRAGHVRAQYQLALCLHQDRRPGHYPQQAARWFLKAAEGGYVRAMYNVSVCYAYGEGMVKSHRQAQKWMKRAAERGHSKAQYEHGLALFSEGAMVKAFVYLELASRAGVAAADRVKNIILQGMSGPSQERAMLLADHWVASSSS